MDDGIRAERDTAEPMPINGTDLHPEGVKNLLRALRREMVKEDLTVVVIAATAYALGARATFDDPEKVGRTRDAIDTMAAAVGLTIEWPTDADGHAIPDPEIGA